ncbi:MAG: hypothetical protein AAGI03_01170 [Pseudomonadota bacterium]
MSIPQKEAREHVTEVADAAKDAMQSTVDAHGIAAKEHAAARLDTASDMMRASASGAPTHSPEAQALEKVAAQVDALAAQIRDADLASITRKTTDFARRNPAVFLGAAALMGFAAVRFLKASGEAESVEFAADPWDMDESLGVMGRSDG